MMSKDPVRVAPEAWTDLEQNPAWLLFWKVVQMRIDGLQNAILFGEPQGEMDVRKREIQIGMIRALLDLAPLVLNLKENGETSGEDA
jgi:hypothetical protein